jgi:hypothetical protein
MKKLFFAILLTLSFVGAGDLWSQTASTEDARKDENRHFADAKAFLDKMGELAPVTESENKIGLFIRSVTKSGNDYIVDYDAKNRLIANSPDNMKYLMTQVYFIDPENHKSRYQPFTIKDGKLNFSFAAGDEITLPIRRIKFEPPSKIMYMYFIGVEKSVSEELYTAPLFFTIILGDNPSVFETTPRHAKNIFALP